MAADHEPEYKVTHDGKRSWFWHRVLCWFLDHKHRYMSTRAADAGRSYCPRCDRHLQVKLLPDQPMLPPASEE